MGILVETLIVVRIDNVVAIFMAENSTTSVQKKDVNIQYHYVLEFVVDKFIKIRFIKSTENHVDEFTKNMTDEVYDGHK